MFDNDFKNESQRGKGHYYEVECYESRRGDPTNAKGSGVLVSSVTECAGEAGRYHAPATGKKKSGSLYKWLNKITKTNSF